MEKNSALERIKVLHEKISCIGQDKKKIQDMQDVVQNLEDCTTKFSRQNQFNQLIKDIQQLSNEAISLENYMILQQEKQIKQFQLAQNLFKTEKAKTIKESLQNCQQTKFHIKKNREKIPTLSKKLQHRDLISKLVQIKHIILKQKQNLIELQNFKNIEFNKKISQLQQQYTQQKQKRIKDYQEFVNKISKMNLNIQNLYQEQHIKDTQDQQLLNNLSQKLLQTLQQKITK